MHNPSIFGPSQCGRRASQRAFGAAALITFASLVGTARDAAAQSPFTPGNLVVVRVGDGAAALGTTATPVFLEEWSPAGGPTPVQTINLTTAGSNVITSSGSATSEGFLTLSGNGQYLIYAGYKATVGTAAVAATTSTTVNRAIARIDLNGVVNTATALSDAVSGGSPRSAVSNDGLQFWICGANGGVRHAASVGATTSTQLNTANPVNLRVLGIANGQLYASSSSTPNLGINSVGTGLPTTAGQTLTLLPGFPTAAGPSTYDYFFADANTVYVADDRTTATGGGLQKWTFNGATWSLAYTMITNLTTGLRGVTGVPGASPMQLFATSTEALNRVVTVQDNGLASPFSTVTTVGTNRVFRGLRYLPVSATPPTVTSQPADITTCPLSPATFTVTATGTAPLSYSWRKDTVPIGGATGSSYTIPSVLAADAGTYDCVVTNTAGSTTSTGAVLLVIAAPAVAPITPAGATLCAGGSTTFSVTATGVGLLGYQWSKDNVDIVGATGSSHTIAAAGPADAGSYSVRVTNQCGATSSPGSAILTVDEAATVTGQPVDFTTCAGTAATFSVTATGTAPISYQWRKNGSPIPGAIAASLTIPVVATSDAGAYDCYVSNDCGNTSSAFASLTVDATLAITAQPVNQSILVGNPALFAVTATGAAPITYQWRKDGAPIAGATNASFAIPATALTDAGSYDVVLGNGCGTLTSAAAILSVTDTPALDVQCYGVGSGSLHTAVGDFVTGNGTDLVVADSAANTVQVWSNNGTGQFAPAVAVTVTGGPRSLAAADFDGDGLLDVAVACPLAGTIEVLYGDGTGGFAAPVLVSGSAPSAVAAVAVLGHTAADLAFADGSALQVAQNAANGTPGARAFAAATTIATGVTFTAVAAADVTGDGIAEIVVADGSSGLLQLIDAMTLAPAMPPLAAGADPLALTLADWNGDLRADIAIAGSGGVALLQTPALTANVVDAAPAVAIVAGRFDIDADVDLAYVTASGDTIVLHGPMTAITPTSFTTLPSPAAGVDLAVGACNPLGAIAGPRANTDELIVARAVGDVCVVRFRAQAAFEPIAGTGCTGPAPIASALGLPVLGNVGFAARLDAAVPNSLTVLAYQVHYPAGSPLTLSAFGLCTHAFDGIQPLNLAFEFADPIGQATVGLPVPAVPDFAGIEVAIQWAVFDGGDPFTGLTLSPAHLARLGEF